MPTMLAFENRDSHVINYWGMAMKVFDSRILRIDLTSGTIRSENLAKYGDFLGGRAGGVNQCILFDELPMGISSLEPSNVLAIGAGLLCGTGPPVAVRVSIDTKNVFTGGLDHRMWVETSDKRNLRATLSLSSDHCVPP